MNWTNDNGQGCDDRRWLPVFEKWLHDLDNSTETNAESPKEERLPFYAQFYTFNTHFPYRKDSKKTPAQPHRYYNSLQTMDEFLKNLFGVLNRTGRLENTIIIGE